MIVLGPTLYAKVEENPQNVGPPPCDGGVADPIKQANPHMCYLVKFGSSVSNCAALGPSPLRWGHE